MVGSSMMRAPSLRARNWSTARINVASYLPSNDFLRAFHTPLGAGHELDIPSFFQAMLSQIKPNIQTRVAVVIVHRHALSLEILKAVDALTHDEIVFAPGVVALRDVNIGIIAERLSGIEVVVIT